MILDFCGMTGLTPEEVLRAVIARSKSAPTTRIQTLFGEIKFIESELLPHDKIVILEEEPVKATQCNA